MLVFFYSSTGTMERIRVAFVGAPKVGKSTVIYQFLYHIFLEDYEPTIEDFFRVQRNGVILEIVDLSGSLQSPESKLRQDALPFCHVVVYMFGMDDGESLSSILSYRKEEKRNLPLVLVGNKMDNNWRVCPNELRNVEFELETSYFPVSAKLPMNIGDLFDKIIVTAKSKSKSEPEENISSNCCLIT